jgi:hypothetical protein
VSSTASPGMRFVGWLIPTEGNNINIKLGAQETISV